MVIDRLRVTTPARTIVDMAANLEDRAMRETIERAQDLRRFKPEEILASLGRRRGCARLADLLKLMGPDEDNARSHLERLFLALVRREHLPRPEVNHPIGGYKRDFVWSDEKLVVEVDGYKHHSSRAAQRRDRRRDRALIARGWRPARFTYEEVAFEPSEVAKELAALLSAPAAQPA